MCIRRKSDKFDDTWVKYQIRLKREGKTIKSSFKKAFDFYKGIRPTKINEGKNNSHE